MHCKVNHWRKQQTSHLSHLTSVRHHTQYISCKISPLKPNGKNGWWMEISRFDSPNPYVLGSVWLYNPSITFKITFKVDGVLRFPSRLHSMTHLGPLRLAPAPPVASVWCHDARTVHRSLPVVKRGGRGKIHHLVRWCSTLWFWVARWPNWEMDSRVMTNHPKTLLLIPLHRCGEWSSKC